MKWISVKEKLPEPFQIIVALINDGEGYAGDPLCRVEIIILRVLRDSELKPLGYSGIYFLPTTNLYGVSFIDYWMPWEEFGFPQSMIIKNAK